MQIFKTILTVWFDLFNMVFFFLNWCIIMISPIYQWTHSEIVVKRHIKEQE